MRPDHYGFLYPVINSERCVECGLCERVCPLIYRKEECDYSNTIIESYALRLKDEEALLKSSSGGAFWAIVKYVIKNGGSVCGATYNENMEVVHKVASTLEEARSFQGSKYSQSNIVGIFPIIKDLLKTGRVVLFSGTPCQNDGLLRFLGKSFDNLITVDIICHSVPSPRYFKEYLLYLEGKYKKTIKDIKMRDKSLGWGKDSYVYYFSEGGSVHNPGDLRCWQTIFESGYITRESCFECQYTNKRRVTDFTIGDFWDFDNLRGDIHSDKGTSVMLLNSEKSIRLFQQIKNDCMYWPVSAIEYEQPRLKYHSERPLVYYDFKETYIKRGFRKSYMVYFYPRQNFLLRVKQYLRRIIKHFL